MLSWISVRPRSHIAETDWLKLQAARTPHRRVFVPRSGPPPTRRVIRQLVVDTSRASGCYIVSNRQPRNKEDSAKARSGSGHGHQRMLTALSQPSAHPNTSHEPFLSGMATALPHHRR